MLIGGWARRSGTPEQDADLKKKGRTTLYHFFKYKDSLSICATAKRDPEVKLLRTISSDKRCSRCEKKRTGLPVPKG